MWCLGVFGFLRAHLVHHRFDAHQTLGRSGQKENLEQVCRVEKRRVTVSISKTNRQKWWQKEDDPNSSFRRREIARVLANEMEKRVVIIDTSNEIAGDSDVPHIGIGRARRMQVSRTDLQHKVMIEAVENHMPEIIIIDDEKKATRKIC